MLAEDYKPERLKFPLMMQPKIDGVRSLNLGVGVTGRSLKHHDNVFTTNFFSQAAFRYLDGEMAAERETHPSLCRLTSSALGRVGGEPYVLWWLFDYMAPDVIYRPYEERYGALQRRVWDLRETAPELGERLRIVPSRIVYNINEVEAWHANHVEEGFEGSILRDPKGVYKNGRSTAIECGLLRIKDFVEEEAVVESIEEGRLNGNEAKTNELGYTERSSHLANMVPNGMVGALRCKDVKTGAPIKVAAGSMSHDERVQYFQNPHLIIGETIKYKTFLHGVKDKPRFPTFQSIRAPSDMS